MNLTPDLFTPAPAARRDDPQTSKAAALSMTGPHAVHQYAIVNVLWRPMTIYHIARLTGLTHVQVARRLPELRTMGHVRPTGKTAAGDTGRECRLWERILP